MTDDPTRTAVARRRVVRRRLDIVVVVAGLAALVVCAVIARDGTVGPTEREFFDAINGLPDGLLPVAQAAQFLGVLVIGPLVALAAALLRRWRLAIAAAAITVGKLAAERAVWEVVQRQRPGTSLPDAIVRGNTPTSGLAFVSGHVILVTALAWAITPYLRGAWRVAPWVVVGLVCLARIYLGAHNPLDVVGGLGLGLAVGGLANLLVGVPVRRRGV